MTTYRVTTQAELDDALAKATVDDEVLIVSERGVCLGVGGSAGAYGSATVRAYGSATVRASGSATVRASDSATVTAYGSATVTASDSATVTAYGSATVTAYGSATVTAYDSATVRAGSHTAVHLHSARATINGGVLVDHTTLNLTTPADWCDYHGVQVTDGHALLYKAVDANLTSDHGTTYPLGETVTAPDWSDTGECGNGLHFGPTPHHADAYHSGRNGSRYLAVHVPIDVLRPITGGGTAKCKARSCTVLHEVDVAGRRIDAEAATA